MLMLSAIDTGSTLLTLPASVATAVHKSIPRSLRLHETWHIPCEGSAMLEVVIGGVKFAVPYSNLAGENSALFRMCHSAVQTNLGDFAIMGDVFIKNHYVVFGEDGKKIRFAHLATQQVYFIEYICYVYCSAKVNISSKERERDRERG